MADDDESGNRYALPLDPKVARMKAWSPEQRANVEQQWAQLFRDVEAALDTDTAGAQAQALAKRWMTLIEDFGGPNQVRSDDTQARYTQWAASTDRSTPYGNPRVWDFIAKALARGGA
jgi:hypothetical protein